MWLQSKLAQQAAEFWELASGPEVFPRSLSGPASLALPLAIHQLSALTTATANCWFAERGISYSITGHSRRLRGCLVAFAGHGFVLVDASDPEDERRFTLAHELAHFLLDYLAPRTQALEALGEDILPVLDGLRVPTRAERLDSILGSAPLGMHVELMERTNVGAYTSKATLLAESRADHLAIELLAPAADALAAISALPTPGEPCISYPATHKQVMLLLQKRYGLPQAQAQAYAGLLLKELGREPGFREWAET